MFNKTRQPDTQLFTIYDSKTDSYREPCFAVNKHDIVRQITNMFEEQLSKNKYFANAEDYSIFQIGDYCYSTGTLVSVKPTHVVNMHELRTLVEMKVKQPSPALIPT